MADSSETSVNKCQATDTRSQKTASQPASQPATFATHLISLLLSTLYLTTPMPFFRWHKVGSRCGVPRGYKYRTRRHGNFVLTVYARKGTVSQIITNHCITREQHPSQHFCIHRSKSPPTVSELKASTWRCHHCLNDINIRLSSNLKQHVMALSLPNKPLLQNLPIYSQQNREV